MDTPKKESNKTLWITLITSIAGLATAVSVAIINQDSASQEDIDKASKQHISKFELLVTQFNETVIPRIERTLEAQAAKIDRLTEENASLRERLVRVETLVGIRGGSVVTRMFKPPAMFSSDEEDKAEGATEASPPEEEPQKIPRLSF